MNDKIFGKFRLSRFDGGYEIVKRIISDLQTIGFGLNKISTTGDHDYHDGIYPFEKCYDSMEAFLENSSVDYRESHERDWSDTFFDLSKGLDIDICLFVEMDHSKPPFPCTNRPGFWVISYPKQRSIEYFDSIIEARAILSKYE